MSTDVGGTGALAPSLPKDFYWGATKLTEFQVCPLRFANRYLRPKNEREWEPGRQLAFGTAVHAGLEAVVALRRGGRWPDRHAVLSYYRDHFLSDYIDGQSRNLPAVRKWAETMLMPGCPACDPARRRWCAECGDIKRLVPVWTLCGYDSAESARWYYVKGANIVGGYLADQAPAITSPDVSGELNFEFELGGRRFRGKIDRVDRYAGRVELRDYKTGRVDCSESAAGDSLQLWVYAAAAACGKIDRVDPSAEIDVVLENVENGTVGKRRMTQALFDRLWAKAGEVIGRAEAGDFTPSPKKNICAYCEVVDCRARLAPSKSMQAKLEAQVLAQNGSAV